MAFKRGDLVEVHSKEEGYVGSYYAAIVVMRLDRNQYVVEYKTLVTDDEKHQLQEIVHASEIRPTPPEVKVCDFRPLDKVDAYDNEGWWVGRIVGRTSNQYHVYFQSSDEKLAYPVDRLRVHQEWKNGMWSSSLINDNKI
ncbi:hypothetical protein IFM89_017771 [Coptis chinensis]|uniref:Agenet domain-containing protein n=1 Tax=Coptis chinensis TaxID=261450 RepID=A0A835I3V4_9MAGN|nr:hypothetical protein IFM89_017771 [Coptis chinensis]